MDEVQGLRELNEKINKLVGIKTIKSLLAGAYTLQIFSMENAPVKTGFLRESHESVEVDNGAEMRVNANYAIYQEMGTEKMPARGFVRKAIDEKGNEILQAIGNEIQKEVIKEVK